jgi:hypothetical protein
MSSPSSSGSASRVSTASIRAAGAGSRVNGLTSTSTAGFPSGHLLVELAVTVGQCRAEPPAAWFLVDELSLYRQVGTAQGMADQLRRLLDVAAMPKITVQVVPAVAHPVNASGFLMADDAVWIEHAASGFVYTDPELVSGIALRFDSLRAESYRASESLALIERLEGIWKAGASPLTQTATAATA